MKIQFKFYLYFTLALCLPLFTLYIWQVDTRLLILPIIIFLILYYLVYKDFLVPLNNISKQVTNYQNQHNTLTQKNSFSQVAKAIDHLIDENQYLYDDMELVLKKQVERLSKKTAALEILYGVAEKLNKITNKKQLFQQFLDIFIEMSGSSGGMAREKIADKLVLVAQKNTHIRDIEVLANSVCAQADGVQFSIYNCSSCTNMDTNIGTVFIPLNYKKENLGSFALFFTTEPSLIYDERLLMQAIADNVAIYLDKLQQQEKNQLAKINKEKLYLSQELHDSLAQTIYSMNLQVSMLEDSLNNKTDNKNLQLKKKIDNLQVNIKQANAELRALIDNFREPIVSKTSEIQKIIDNFISETNIKTYVQIDDITLNDEVQMQITRIISEALTNIKKHAQANNVRIIYNNSQLLIEDDGIGFIAGDKKDGHIGTKIMQERAERIGAKFYLESDKNDGTIIIINYENLPQ